MQAEISKISYESSTEHTPPFVSIVIPVFNEERRVEGFLHDVFTFVQMEDFSCELIIVDDGSTDKTVTIVERLLQQYKNVHYQFLQLPVNQGKGAAVREGMLAAQGDYIFFIDADGSTSIREIKTFMPYLNASHDVYIGVRTKKHKAPLKRKIFGYGYIYLANLILGTHISDFTCGFKCYRRDAAQKIFSLQTMHNWSFDAENLFVAKKYHYRVKEIPVYWKHCGGSKVKVLHNVVVCGYDLLRIRWRNMCGRYA